MQMVFFLKKKNIYTENADEAQFVLHGVSTLLMRMNSHSDIQAESCLCMFGSWKHSKLTTDVHVAWAVLLCI